jgi:HSP20 family molecular chaperone IbpA
MCAKTRTTSSYRANCRNRQEGDRYLHRIQCLTIKGQKKGETEEKRGKYYRKESWSGSFHRTLPLPSLVDGDKITAQLSNGVLTITLPKREEAKPKQIAVNVT